MTNSGTVTAKLLSSGLSVAIGAYNGGVATNTGSITVNNNSGGTISGNVSLGTSPFNIATATFNNNSGGVWNVNGSNWFGGNANTINNFGTINIAAFSAFYPVLGSTFTFNNSGAVNVLANSAAYIGAAVSSISGPGSFSIGDRSELEFGNSVAAGQTVSFVDGKGVLTLDQPSAFGGTIAGLVDRRHHRFSGRHRCFRCKHHRIDVVGCRQCPELELHGFGPPVGHGFQCAVRRQDRDGSDFCAHGLGGFRPYSIRQRSSISSPMMRSPDPQPVLIINASSGQQSGRLCCRQFQPDLVDFGNGRGVNAVNLGRRGAPTSPLSARAILAPSAASASIPVPYWFDRHYRLRQRVRRARSASMLIRVVVVRSISLSAATRP